ncbi:hypothetical protein CYLTODRAFT_388978 [Cylindrobasidium torrendii FP15055 ss-10]|uniref:RING-type domain-containing protein n=1 Tax=Cylindrobasidium torrendii FP15055 ss-10 TaxID=1314674 RepID=A0A0D7BP57_9AGAR|nr:hypothetical protein CYLTODRAFT_388978 [Cylindrobasidium torrendii FP15055 ss-10]
MPLLLGSGSTCDVCLDAFDADNCAPCSIECGHIFCLKCLNALSRPKCPLCRSRFEPQSVVKLHIDVDEVRPPSQAHDGPRALSDDQVVANSYQERIASACNEGSSEPALRQLIDECRQFLGQQPRNSFSDLRVSLRMINHVYNIKLDQLKHRQEIKRLTDDIASLQTDKANLEKMVKEIEDEHKQERDAWQAHEANLREFCSKAQGAYFGVAEYVLSHF